MSSQSSMRQGSANLINNIDFENSEFDLNEEEKDRVEEEVRFEVNTSNPTERSHIINNMSISTITNTRINFLSDSSAQNNAESLQKLQSLMPIIFRYNSSLQKVVFSKKPPTAFYVSKHRDLCAIKCEVITTYFVKNATFSIFSNPHGIEENEIVKVKILNSRPENENSPIHKFWISDLEDDVILMNLDQNKFFQFFEEVNFYFSSPEIRKIEQRTRKQKFIYYTLTVFLMILLILVIILSFFYDLFVKPDNSSSFQFWIIIVIVMFIAIILIYLALRSFLMAYVYTTEVHRFDTLSHYIKNYPTVQKTFDKWNINLFLLSGIIVSTPVSLDYIIFNFEPDKDIVLDHHEMDERNIDDTSLSI
jgi:hypothetical protein